MSNCFVLLKISIKPLTCAAAFTLVAFADTTKAVLFVTLIFMLLFWQLVKFRTGILVRVGLRSDS